MCVFASVCVFVYVCVFFMKMDKALAQALYIFFSYIQHHQIKQITQIKKDKFALFIHIIEINIHKIKLKCAYVITDAIYKERLKIFRDKK